MLRVVVYINQTPIIDTHVVRISPSNPKNGTLCTYQIDHSDKLVRSRFSKRTGAAKLAIKLLNHSLQLDSNYKPYIPNQTRLL